MDCPVDGTVLAMTDRQGIEIDYCPKCRGVWLDRGELDKLLERSDRDDDDDDDDRDERRYDKVDRDERRYDKVDRDDRRYDKPKKKKKSLFSELFESLGE